MNLKLLLNPWDKGVKNVLSHQNITQPRLFKSLLILFTFCIIAGNSFGQQSFLGLDGGFEGSAIIDNATQFTSPQANKWSKANANLTIINETTVVRSGSHSLKLIPHSNAYRVWSPQITFTRTINKFYIQYFRRAPSTTNTTQNGTGIIREGIESPSAYTYSAVTSIDTWEKVTYSPTSTTDATTVVGVIMAKMLNSGGEAYYDDFCIYEASSIDNIAPSSPGSVMINNPTNASLDVNWTTSVGGVDGGGYMVIRYTFNPNADNDPNQNGIYAVGNITTNGTGSLVGKICYVGTATYFTDNNLNPNTTYYYKVYSYDKAYNYSSEVTTNGTTTNLSTFMGTTSNSWNTDSNWSPAGVPPTTSDVRIPNGMNVTIAPTSQASCNNLNIEGTLTINSDATNSGSLIINGTSTGNITYNRYLTKDKWHLISAPVATQPIQAFATNPVNNITMSGAKYSVSPYDNSEVKGVSTWKYWTSDATNPISGAGDFVAGKGYQILTKTTDATVAFTGTTPVSTVSLPVTVSTANGTNGWNLVGNPYPAAIPVNSLAHATQNFITSNSAAIDPSYAAIYVWDPVAAAYTIINNGNPAKHLAPGQGFFVKSVPGGGIINFTPQMRTHITTTFHRIVSDETPRITMIAESGAGNKSNTDLNYFDNASLGLDPGYDAGRFGATASGFGIYTKLVEDNGVDFAVQALPINTFNTAVIPVGLDAVAGTTISFKANYTNLPEQVKVFLEDQLTGTINEINSSDKTYTLTLTENSNGTGRFFLRTSSPQGTLSVNEVTNTSVKVVPMYNNHQLKVTGNLSYPATLIVYDQTGRMILSRMLTTAHQNTVSVPQLKKGVYVVKIAAGQQYYNTKIIWTPIY